MFIYSQIEVPEWVSKIHMLKFFVQLLFQSTIKVFLAVCGIH